MKIVMNKEDIKNSKAFLRKHFKDDNGNIKNTEYFIDTIVFYKLDKNYGKQKIFRVDKIGFDDYRMIR